MSVLLRLPLAGCGIVLDLLAGSPDPLCPHWTLLCALGCWLVWPTFMSVLALWLLVNLSLWEESGGRSFPSGYKTSPKHTL